MSLLVRRESKDYEWIPASADDLALPPRTHDAPRISACLVVRNAAGTIERCLRSLAGVVDEIVVVHDGDCTDGTLDTARRYGARIVVAPARGHSEWQTPLAYEQATGNWILSIDADEFLSDGLRAELRTLVAATGVDGYACYWWLWDGVRYVTRKGPHKLVLFRRDRTRLVGVVHNVERIDGIVVRVPLLLEHRQPGEPRRFARILATWRKRGALHARELLMDLNDIPRFNYPGTVRWTRRRLLINRLAPLLIVPIGVYAFLRNLCLSARELGIRESLRGSALDGLYQAMVTAYVARDLYFRRSR